MTTSMSASYIGHLLIAAILQIAAGYFVALLIGVRKRRHAACAGALFMSLFVAYLSLGPPPYRDYGPLLVWVLTALFFWWRIGRDATVKRQQQ
jgi:drug/metabolite transporter superfamily protein YnfA